MKTDIEFLAGYLKKSTGIIIVAEKAYLVESRLAPIATKHGVGSVAELVEKLKGFPSADLQRDVIEAMTTNETSFFRDGTPFEAMKQHIMPALMAARGSNRKLRIWCAAASTGQEPYSIAILLEEMGLRRQGWSVEIVGTDLDSTVLRKAQAGSYSKFEIQRGLPIALLLKYFDQNGPDSWSIKQNIKEMISYRSANLLQEQSLGMFDVIFCRNVLIYFDPPTKQAVLGRLAKHLANDGTLFLGGAETVLGITDKFALCNGVRGAYAKARAADAPAVRAA